MIFPAKKERLGLATPKPNHNVFLEKSHSQLGFYYPYRLDQYPSQCWLSSNPPANNLGLGVKTLGDNPSKFGASGAVLVNF